jgi:hypothetical protein
MSHFFATHEDLLPVFASVEVRYTRMERNTSSDVEWWQAGKELPTLAQHCPTESAAAGPAYLVTLRSTPAKSRKLAPLGEHNWWVVDQLENPDSTVLWHGGFFSEDVLLYGRVATVSRSPIALKLQRAYESAMRNHFNRTKAFYIGSKAEALLDAGVRLAIGASSPSQYDLSRG